jgi:hypothetical protein
MCFERRRETLEQSVDKVLNGVEASQINRHQNPIRPGQRMLDQARFTHTPLTQEHDLLLMNSRLEYARLELWARAKGTHAGIDEMLPANPASKITWCDFSNSPVRSTAPPTPSIATSTTVPTPSGS